MISIGAVVDSGLHTLSSRPEPTGCLWECSFIAGSKVRSTLLDTCALAHVIDSRTLFASLMSRLHRVYSGIAQENRIFGVDDEFREAIARVSRNRNDFEITLRASVGNLAA